MTLLTDWNDGTNTEFGKKVAAALLNKIGSDLQAADFETTATDRVKRLYQRIVDRPESVARDLAPLISANSNVNTDSSDVQIQNLVNASVTALSILALGDTTGV